VLVGEYLHFNVSWRSDILLDQHDIVSEGASSLRFGGLELREKITWADGDAHTFPSAAFDAFQKYRKPNLLRLGLEKYRILVHTMVARNAWDSGCSHNNLRLTAKCQPDCHQPINENIYKPFVPHRLDSLPWRTDEDQPRLCALSCESRILAQLDEFLRQSAVTIASFANTHEAISWMYPYATFFPSNVDNSIPIKIGGRVAKIDSILRT